MPTRSRKRSSFVVNPTPSNSFNLLSDIIINSIMSCSNCLGAPYLYCKDVINPNRKHLNIHTVDGLQKYLHSSESDLKKLKAAFTQSVLWPSHHHRWIFILQYRRIAQYLILGMETSLGRLRHHSVFCPFCQRHLPIRIRTHLWPQLRHPYLLWPLCRMLLSSWNRCPPELGRIKWNR